MEPERGVRLPVVIKGRRACPPEDAGGPRGYQRFLDSMADPSNAQHEMYTTWVGAEFKPDVFDLAGVNKIMRE